jgi:hypothetical protein
MRPVAIQSRFTTPWLGSVFWLIQLLQPFDSGSQLFQPFGAGIQLFQSFDSAISFSSLCHGSEMDWMQSKAPYPS